MEFLDMLGKKASEAYKITADKTGKIAKETKMKLRIGELKNQVNGLYQKIGKEVYEKHVLKEKYENEEMLEELCTQIDVLSDEIDDLSNQCLELRDKKQCPKCFKEVNKEDNFCPSCGEKLEVVEEPAKEVETVEDSQNEEEIDNEEIQTNEIIEDEDIETQIGETTEGEEKEEKEEQEENAEYKENLEKTVEVESNAKYVQDNEEEKED